MEGLKWLQKQEHFDWMQKCLTCWKMTEEFIAYSLENQQYLSSISICRDVSEMCSQCIKFEAQRSPFFKHLCEVSAEMCKSCAKELLMNEKKNDLLKLTANACDIFAEASLLVANKLRKTKTFG